MGMTIILISVNQYTLLETSPPMISIRKNYFEQAPKMLFVFD